MSFDRNKAIEYMAKANNIIPKIVILMVVCWIASPIIMGIGSATDIAVFSVLGVFISFISSILFYVLIFFIVIKVGKIQIKSEQPSETSENNAPQNEYTPTQVQEPEYTTVFREAENYEISSMEEQKQFEKEMFAMQHPILAILQRKVIPFIWFLAILCLIIVGVIYLLDNVFGVKIHF